MTIKQYLIFLFSVLTGISATAQNQQIATPNFPGDSVTVFNEPGYKLKLRLTDTVDGDNIPANAVLTLSHQHKIILQDSLYCQFLRIGLSDFNNDGVKDVLILHSSSVRSDWAHYLYLVDSKTHKLHRVKGFENLLNPQLNTKTGIITSTAHYSDKEFLSFYKIVASKKLVKAGRSYERTIE